MTLSEGDKAICMEIAREIVEKSLVLHSNTCPIGQTIKVKKAQILALFIGISLGSGLSGGGIVMLILKALN